DAKGAAFLWNASYNFNLGNNWFVRPSVGGVWSRTEIDKINVGGGFLVDANVTNSLTLPGVVEIAPIDTLLGRASLTAGGTIVSGNLAWQPFATASVFHEFAGSVRTRMSGDLSAATGLAGFPTLDATSSTSRVGTYAHVGVGLAGTIVNTGWLGYVKADYLTGDNIEAWSVNAGLRYQFQPAAAVGMKDDGPVARRGIYDWSGLYAGTLTGGLIGRGDWTDAQGPTEPKFSGYSAGGTLGYNIQHGSLVLGIEGDSSFTNAKGGRDCPGAGFDAFFFACEVDMTSLSTVTGRIGYARERALFFLKGGLAIGQVEARTQANIASPGFDLLGNALAFPGTREDSKTLTGWALGGGVEFAITESWSAKAEYLHFDLGKSTFQTFDNGPGRVFPADIVTKGDTVRIGVNYHFGHRGEQYETLK
ncbi:MAG: autotransporter outer membrane beta-barrel domain-containing protein, partial [Hyphomicrobiaceae bacterium]